MMALLAINSRVNSTSTPYTSIVSIKFLDRTSAALSGVGVNVGVGDEVTVGEGVIVGVFVEVGGIGVIDGVTVGSGWRAPHPESSRLSNNKPENSTPLFIISPFQ